MGKIDLSSIELPAEDANKPAELDTITPEGDGDALENTDGKKGEAAPAAADDQDGAKEKLGPTEGESQEDPTKIEKPAEDKKDAAPAAGENADDPNKPADKKEAEKKDDAEPAGPATPPDAAKLAEQNRDLEIQKAKLEGRLEEMEKKGTVTPDQKKEVKSAAKIAEEAVLAKYKEGWEPKDGLELNRVYGEELEKALEQKENEKASARQVDSEKLETTRKEIQKQVDDTYAELGITDQKEQDKVAEQAMKWAKEGTANWSLNTLKLAAEHLKLKGEILKPAAAPQPKPVVEDKGDPAKVEEKKADPKVDVNKKISRPTSEGGTGATPPKRSISELRRNSLDDIVANAVGKLS